MPPPLVALVALLAIVPAYVPPAAPPVPTVSVTGVPTAPFHTTPPLPPKLPTAWLVPLRSNTPPALTASGAATAASLLPLMLICSVPAFTVVPSAAVPNVLLFERTSVPTPFFVSPADVLVTVALPVHPKPEAATPPASSPPVRLMPGATYPTPGFVTTTLETVPPLTVA